VNRKTYDNFLAYLKKKNYKISKLKNNGILLYLNILDENNNFIKNKNNKELIVVLFYHFIDFSMAGGRIDEKAHQLIENEERWITYQHRFNELINYPVLDDNIIFNKYSYNLDTKTLINMNSRKYQEEVMKSKIYRDYALKYPKKVITSKKYRDLKNDNNVTFERLLIINNRLTVAFLVKEYYPTEIILFGYQLPEDYSLNKSYSSKKIEPFIPFMYNQRGVSTATESVFKSLIAR
jgi:hypothetical protein